MTMTRRELLTAAATAALALPARPRAEPRRREGPADEPIPGLDARIARLLGLAALAPSSHNVQPWWVRVLAPDRLAVGLEPARALPEVDGAGREMAISLGCFLENLAHAAPAEALRAEVEAGGVDAPASATIRLVSGPADAAGADRIRRRRTLRTGHLPRPLTADDTASVLALAGPGAQLLARGSAGAARVAEATVEAMRQQTLRDAAQRELAGWIRFREGDVAEHGDGLTVDSMEAGGVAGFAMRHFFDADSVMGRRFREAGMAQCARQVTEGAGFLVVTSPDARAPALVEAGRRFERLALALRERGIAAHPMSQALEEAPWRDELGTALGVGPPIQLVVRLGYVDRYPEPVSPRRPIAAFVRG